MACAPYLAGGDLTEAPRQSWEVWGGRGREEVRGHPIAGRIENGRTGEGRGEGRCPSSRSPHGPPCGAWGSPKRGHRGARLAPVPPCTVVVAGAVGGGLAAAAIRRGVAPAEGPKQLLPVTRGGEASSAAPRERRCRRTEWHDGKALKQGPSNWHAPQTRTGAPKL